MKNKLFYICILVILSTGSYFLWSYTHKPTPITTDKVKYASNPTKSEPDLDRPKMPSVISPDEVIAVENVDMSPVFDKYPVQKIFSGQSAPLDLKSHPIGLEYITRITDEYSQGANFAGHYTLVIWGCGASCQQFTLVDNLTGKIYGDYVTEQLTNGGLSYGVDFNIKSNLIIINSPDSPDRIADSESYPARYYKLEKNALVLIHPSDLEE